MKNIISYIKRNIKEKDYVVSIEPYYSNNKLEYKELKMEVCYNDEEYLILLNNYKKFFEINEEVINALCVFIELDDVIIRILDNEYIRAPYCSVF